APAAAMATTDGKRRHLVALAAALAVGCGSKSAPPDAAAPPPDVAPAGGPAAADSAVAAGLALDDFVARYCDRLGPCCALASLPSGAGACRTMTRAAAGSGYRAGTAASCLAALDASAGTPAFCTDGYTRAARVCDRVFSAVVATQHPGDPCAHDEECLLSSEGSVSCAGAAAGMGRCQFELPG